ncbi:uncharacterized protein C8Q71DRAFT_806502 [Rhodofomes roseus]|uniref:IPT/TIG domain-containing protein n=1 Tax=Rhodofomes roseus TaxID=34475 RepID=A0ABQ8KMA6_9APHY|nr:uncharacterized protein C8Q71DRAFT_806502 [Rhodofomes roseus]KAH9839336.1 hypothetical protein C8Q71DRAFT_806502 [Rhodofomes roseus]
MPTGAYLAICVSARRGTDSIRGRNCAASPLPAIMSSSSTTACSRSSSPSPATPESTDVPEQVFSTEDLSAWCNSLVMSSYSNGHEQRQADASHANVAQMLKLEDLLQDALYQEIKPGASDPTLSLDPLTLSKLALPQDYQSSLPSTPLPSTLSQVPAPVKPVPPPPSQPRPDPALTAQRVVYPPKEACQNLPIMIPNIPEGGTKSRVETQVRLTVDLAHASASSGEPLKYDRVGTFKWLRLPKGTSTKRRTRKEGKVDASPEDTLYLTAEVTCATAPHTRVTCCTSCQAREAKRVARKIAARVRPSRSDAESQDEVPFLPGRGTHEDVSNIVQFNCPEVLDFSSGSVILPLRITCYCRHHREKTGFNVHFAMLDRYGRIVGTGMTRPIMITDDHKTTGAQKAAQNNDMALGESSDMGGSAKRKKTTASERVKKRTKPYDVGQSTGRTVRRGSSASADSPLHAASPAATRSSSPLQSYAHSPLSAFSPVESQGPQSLFDFNAPTPDDGPTSIDSDVPMAQEVSPEAVATIHPLTGSFLPPSHADPQLSVDPTQTLNMPPQPAPFFLFAQNPPPPMASLPAPKIHRLIPASGPTFGGIEVTVLGANFHSSMQLNLLFGGVASSSTQRWSDNTLVCLLPPRADPGIVTVWLEGVEKIEDGTPPCMFTYTDETDRALMELALQVVGLKMTGKIEDARNVAMRIVGNTNTEGADGSAAPVDSVMQLSSGPDLTPNFRSLLLSRAGNNGDFERVLLDFLSILDHSIGKAGFSDMAAISHPTPSGQTLLHLATMAKFPTLVEFLVSHGVDVDARDKNGCTALYCAATVRSAECARVLLRAGADTEVVDALGKTPSEIAPLGFFDFALSDGDTSRSADNDEEEAAWGDAEEESDESEVKGKPRRRFGRKSGLRKRRSSHALAERDTNTATRAGPHSSESKKAIDAGMPDEKQVASFMETLQRAFAQWQAPQGMMANMPAALHNLPIPHLPNLPGIPAWNALPQVPAVFPVFVPIPALVNLWGERRTDDRQQPARDKKDGAEIEAPLSPTQDWRGFWEKMMAQAGATLRPNDGTIDAPPAYSPRSVDEEPPTQVKQEVVASSSSVKRNAGLTKSSTRHVEHPTVAVPEQELDAYLYRPAHKPSRKQKKKHDRMLILFWIPILMIGLMWAFFTFIRMAFHATRAVLIIKTGMKV